MFIVNGCRSAHNQNFTLFKLLFRTFPLSTRSKSHGKKKDNQLYPIITPTEEEKLKTISNLQNLLNDIKVCTSSDELDSAIKIPQPKRAISNKNVEETNLKFASWKIKNKLADSVNKVAKNLGGDIAQTKSELLKMLKNIDYKNDEIKLKKSVQEAEMHKNLKISKVIINLVEDIYNIENKMVQDFIFSETETQGLEIFEASSEFEKAEPSFWEELEKEHLKFLVTSPPRNYFEELIQWTEQGKLWHFPINNEQGMDEEAKVGFEEHVFLEDQLEPWCPKKGPIRHFMELVLVGLSKNPYLTVEEKHEHIHWFRDYFEDKKEVVALVEQSEPSSNSAI